MEIDLPSSGLAKVNYPDVFPTPPAGSPEPPDHSSIPTDRAPDRISFSAQGLEPDQQQIWKYYLSEIAVRKIGNRLMNCFYKDDESVWLSMPLERMIRVADELDLQLTQWYIQLRILSMSLTFVCTGSKISPAPSPLQKKNSRTSTTDRSPTNCSLFFMRA